MMLRTVRTTLALAGAAVALSVAPALADGPPEVPPHQSAAAGPAQPAQAQQVAPAPTQAPVRAAPVQPPSAQAQSAQAQAAAADWPPRTGEISLANGAVTVTTPAGYTLYSPAEAQAYLQRANAPAPRGEVLGLLAPAGTRPSHQDFWGAVVAYEPIGYVSSASAANLSSADLTNNVRSARAASQRGFEGFAAQPTFDASAASLTWAERSAQPAASVRDLRHEQRVLGRAGVASLTSVGRSDQLSDIVAAAPAMLQTVSFPAAQRYADFNSASDQVSRVDLPGLVVGADSGVAQVAGEAGAPAAQKQGFLGGAGLQGLFPWIAGGVVLLAALGWLVLGRGRKTDTDDDGPAVDEGARQTT